MKRPVLWSFVVVLIVFCVITAVTILLVRLPATSTKGTRNLSRLSNIGVAASGYFNEYAELPSHFDESFYRVLSGEDLGGANPKGIRFLNNPRKHLKLGHDVGNRPVRVLLNDEMILTWSAGEDGIFEDLPGRGDDNAIITEFDRNAQ